MREELPVFEETKIKHLEAPFIILERPKYAHNVGGAVRALSCFVGVGTILYSGDRFAREIERRLPREERMRDYREIALVNTERPFDLLPKGVVPVGIEIMSGSVPITQFVHPEYAAYVFGPEDGSLCTSWRRLCHQFVTIPTNHCLNLAAAINVVLYSRIAS